MALTPAPTGIATIFTTVDGKRYAKALPDSLYCLTPTDLAGVELAGNGDWLYLCAENIAGGTAKYVRDETQPTVWHRYAGLLSGEAPTAAVAVAVAAPTAIVPAKPVPMDECDALFYPSMGTIMNPTPEDFARARQYLDAAIDAVYDGTRSAFDQLRHRIEAGRVVVNPRVASFTPADIETVIARETGYVADVAQPGGIVAGDRVSQEAQDAHWRALYGRDYIGMDELPAVLREAGRARWSPGSIAGGISWAPGYGAAQWLPPSEPSRTMSGYRAEHDRRELRAIGDVVYNQLREIVTSIKADEGERAGNYADQLSGLAAALGYRLRMTAADDAVERYRDDAAAAAAAQVFERERGIAAGAMRAAADAPTIKLPGTFEPDDSLEVRITNTAPTSSFGGNGAMIGGDP